MSLPAGFVPGSEELLAPQGCGTRPGPPLRDGPDNPLCPAGLSPSPASTLSESEAAGLAAPRWPAALPRAPRAGHGRSDNPSQGLDAGLTEATLGPPPSMGWPGCLGQPVGDAGLDRPVTGGSPAGLRPGASPLRVRGLLAVQGNTRNHPQVRGPLPSPKTSMGPGRCWPASGAATGHQGLTEAVGGGGAWGSRAPGVRARGRARCDSRPWTQNSPAGNKAPTRSGGLLHGRAGQAPSGNPGPEQARDSCSPRPQGALL